MRQDNDTKRRYSPLSILSLSALLTLGLIGGVACQTGMAEKAPDETSQKYTRPAAETGLEKTMTGEITELSDTSVTLETSTGTEVIQINSDTTGRDLLIEGHEVSVDYRSTNDKAMVATNIEHVEEEDES